ncbi:MAG: phosphoribosylanthranilate isomerase [Acidaminobacteraceae bacterium]
MKIKICGVTDIDTAKKVCEYGADYIGFVFAKSKRQITVEKAKVISNQIGSSIKKVGVFVDEKADDIIRISNYCDLDYIQLHGSETLEGYKCKQKIIRSISVDINEESDLDENLQGLMNSYDHILFDTKVGKQAGGSGISFNWSKLVKLNLKKQRCFLAGGINIVNVEEAIRLVNPYAIDVSSGVEINGEKDVVKIREFIELIRSGDCEL